MQENKIHPNEIKIASNYQNILKFKPYFGKSFYPVKRGFKLPVVWEKPREKVEILSSTLGRLTRLDREGQLPNNGLGFWYNLRLFHNAKDGRKEEIPFIVNFEDSISEFNILDIYPLQYYGWDDVMPFLNYGNGKSFNVASICFPWVIKADFSKAGEYYFQYHIINHLLVCFPPDDKYFYPRFEFR